MSYIEAVLFFGSGVFACDAAEHHNVYERIAADAVTRMDAAGNFARSIKTGNRSAVCVEYLSVFIDFKTAHRMVNRRFARRCPKRTHVDFFAELCFVKIGVFARFAKTVVFGDFGRKRFGIAADLCGETFKRIRSKNAAVFNQFVDVVAPIVLAAVLRISRSRLIADNPKHSVRLLQRGLCQNVAAFVLGQNALAFLIYKNLIFGACPQTAAEGTCNRMRTGHKLNESHADKICTDRFTHKDAVAGCKLRIGSRHIFG